MMLILLPHDRLFPVLSQLDAAIQTYPLDGLSVHILSLGLCFALGMRLVGLPRKEQTIGFLESAYWLEAASLFVSVVLLHAGSVA